MIVAVLSGMVYYNRVNYQNAYKNIRLSIGIDKPCGQPIKYSIGEFDERFGINRADFLHITNQAAQIWNLAINKNLLTSSEDGGLKINLIYDDRQSSTVQLNDMGSSINSDKKSLNDLKTRYDSLKSSYNAKKAQVESMMDSYKIDKSIYNQINQANQELNAIVKDLNSTADRINSLGKSINSDVSDYNTVSLSNGQEFQEGEYVSDKNGERINIYQYKDYGKLQRVLEHELGHALGLEHVEDPKAIMYTYNSGNNEKLTDADLAELKKVCQVK